tara:strand:- start:1581 stop:2525 length:945 start_codon:yes stop_codon:yes gene_type:complete
METIAETQTLTQRAVGELTEFNELIAVVIPYGELTVMFDGIGKVEEAHKAVKRLNSNIEKKRKELKSGALEYGRAVDSIAKQLSEQVDAIEVKLKAERDAFDAIEKAEKAAKEAEKAAKKQGRVNEMVAAGIAVDWAAVELSDEEWMWWLSKAKSQAAVLLEEKLKAEAFAEQQRNERDELAAKMQAEADHERKLQAEELRIRAEEMEIQRVQDAARMAAERRQLEAEREELRRKLWWVIRRAEVEEAEAKRVEETKRREDAAKPELERLEAAINKMESCCDLKPFPWWYPELGLRFERFADSMRDFVREGEDA